MIQIFEQISEIKRELRGRRRGWYVSRVTDAVQSLRRVQHTPEWLVEGAIDRARRISSPLLDVIPAVGTRLAMISQDGDPARPASVGMIWDDLAKQMTAWLRANLAEHPGHLELGAENGLTIIIGEQRVDITPENGVLRIEAKGVGAKVVVEGQSIELGEGALQEALMAGPLNAYIVALFDAHTHTDPISGSTGPPLVLSPAHAALYDAAKTTKAKVS